MSELARRRDAREVWVSRSHLHAAVVGAFLVSVISFAIGYALGTSKTGAAEAPRHATLVGHVPGHQLVELLAEVERAGMLHPSEAMVHPDFVASGSGLTIPTVVAEPPGVAAEVPPPPLAAAPVAPVVVGDGLRVEVARLADEVAALDLRDGLLAQGHGARIGLERVDGRAEWTVFVGPFEARAQAEAVQAELAAAAPALTGGGTPVVVGGTAD